MNKTKYILFLTLIFNFYLSCSTSSKLFVDGVVGNELNQLPDEFEVTGGLGPNIISRAFLDKTKDYGLLGIKAYNLNIIDLNGDNYSDIVVIPSFYSRPEFYIYNIHKHVFEKSASPFSENFKISFVLFYDLNKDKIIDAITGVLNQETELSGQPLRIFYGKRNKEKVLAFEESKAFGAASPNSSINLIDYNLDGELDIFVGNWFKRINKSPFPTADQLFVYKKGKYFEMTELLRGETRQNPDKTMLVNAAPTYGSQVCDIDQNGFPDIITTSTNKYKNKLWMNRYKFREQYRYFENIGNISGVAGDPEGLINSQGSGRTFSVACADYNNDGIMDLFLGELSHNYDNEATDKSSLLTGRSMKYPPKFYRTEYFVDNFDTNWHQADRRGIWIDLNNDGLMDLIIDNSGYPPYTKLIIFEQSADHSFENKSREYGVDIVNPIATVIADFNRDGKMDFLTSQSQIRDESINSRLYLFENNMELPGRRSLRFFLRGKKANYHGLNAMIILKVKALSGISTRRQVVSYSYGSLPPQNEEGVHFGLAQGESVISVTVRWPYSTSLNQTRAGLEKTYKIKNDFSDYMNITLCEEGTYLVGRRKCN